MTSFRPATVACALLLALSVVGATSAEADATLGTAAFTLVTEGARPPGIISARKVERDALQSHPRRAAAENALRARIASVWPQLRGLQVSDLARFDRDALQAATLPTTPAFHDGVVLAVTEDAMHLMVRGPRLPASFEMVQRHLVFFARYEWASGQVRDVSVSIRAEVGE